MFCNLSGQSINIHKSKILFSKNCPLNTAKEITNCFNIKISQFFGKYLGFPIVEKNPKAADYQFIIAQMRGRLSSWKINFLNIAGRTTLALSTLNFIPNHAMQYTILSARIQKQIDRIQKNFIWGSTNEVKKLHLINWKTITNPKEVRGLNLKMTSSKNTTLLSSLIWHILTNPIAPWANLLITKYGHKRTTHSSFIWKSIPKGWTTCSKGILWQPSRNSNQNIWCSRWIPDLPPLRNCIEGPLQNKEENLKLKDIIINGKWNLSKISLISQYP